MSGAIHRLIDATERLGLNAKGKAQSTSFVATGWWSGLASTLVDRSMQEGSGLEMRIS
jgi:hypothetical protein